MNEIKNKIFKPILFLVSVFGFFIVKRNSKKNQKNLKKSIDK